MRKLIPTLALLGAGVVFLPTAPASQAADLTYLYEVAVDEGVSPASHAAMFLDYVGIAPEQQAGRLKHVYPNLVNGYAVELTYEEAEKADRIVLEDDDVISFNRSFEVESGPVAIQGVGDLSEQIEPLALQRMGMPDKLEPCASDLEGSTQSIICGRPVIAVLDTGTDANHPDLNVAPGFNAVEPGAEIIDVVGHSTFVSTLIAAEDDADGIRGAAPGATIIPVKVLGDTGSGSTADIIAGFEYVAGLVLSGQRVDVINMSLGGQNPETECGTGEDLMHEAVCEITKLGVAVVVSAGNSGGPSTMQSPANYEEALTVSAFADYDGLPGGLALTPQTPCTVGTVDDGFALFSSFGENVDITAMGVCNVGGSPTTWAGPGAPFVPYGSGSGTSFSAPLVSGALARYRAKCPTEPVRVAIEQLLRYSELNGGTVSGDPDGVAEPVLWLGDIPCRGA